MSVMLPNITFPIDPLTRVNPDTDLEMRRRSVEGVLESYHSNYDVLSEGIQNAVDAVEDARLEELAAPYLIEVTINLSENWIGILDTGIGMTPQEVASAFAPQASFKHRSAASTKRSIKNLCRGYKGVGLTFLAYGTDDIVIHSKKEGGELTKARMQYGRAWAKGERTEVAYMVEDSNPSPLEQHLRGTYVQIQLSQDTRPKSLNRIASTVEAWKVILRTKTAIGQVLLGREATVELQAKLKLVDDTKTSESEVEATFLYPHKSKRTPPFRFLDLVGYYAAHKELAKPPADKVRQDGLYLIWGTERIKSELSQDMQTRYADQFKDYSPAVYAFVPYNVRLWIELNQIEAGVSHRTYLNPGLMLAVNRQRLADISEIKATRYENFGKTVFVIVHFDNVKPDQGRKTIEATAEELAKDIANRVVQYLGKQIVFLRPAGDAPTPEQRQIEKDHDDWVFNVKTHARSSPLHIPPITYVSTPLAEQDVVGLFHQLSSIGVFPGIKIFATSQSRTYDCLVEFDCSRDEPGLLYGGKEANPLGVSSYILGDRPRFATKQLTVEFKNNLDALIIDIESDNSPKTFGNIDVCVCWGQISESFKGYELEPITEAKIDERKYPGITHLLRHDGDAHVLGVIMLSTVTDMIRQGKISMPLLDNAQPS